MLMGVPLIGFSMNISLNILFGGWFGYFSGHRYWMFLWWLSLIPAIHLIMKEICNRDHHLFRIIELWLDTRARNPLETAFGAPSMPAFAYEFPRKYNDFHVSLTRDGRS